jgi:hypothetical protein
MGIPAGNSALVADMPYDLLSSITSFGPSRALCDAPGQLVDSFEQVTKARVLVDWPSLGERLAHPVEVTLRKRADGSNSIIQHTRENVVNALKVHVNLIHVSVHSGVLLLKLTRQPAAGDLQMQSDADYFRERAAQQTEAANNAGHTKARTAHLELALRYELLADAIATKQASLRNYL